MGKRVADVLVDTLAAHGVERIYGVSGDSLNGKALEHDGPALVEVAVSRQELAMPSTITVEQMTGFSSFMLRAVLSGRGDEIIDLAKVNLFR